MNQFEKPNSPKITLEGESATSAENIKKNNLEIKVIEAILNNPQEGDDVSLLRTKMSKLILENDRIQQEEAARIEALGKQYNTADTKGPWDNINAPKGALRG